MYINEFVNLLRRGTNGRTNALRIESYLGHGKDYF